MRFFHLRRVKGWVLIREMLFFRAREEIFTIFQKEIAHKGCCISNVNGNNTRQQNSKSHTGFGESTEHPIETCSVTVLFPPLSLLEAENLPSSIFRDFLA